MYIPTTYLIMISLRIITVIMSLILLEITISVLYNHAQTYAQTFDNKGTTLSMLYSKLKDSIVKVSSTDRQGHTLIGSGFVYDNAGHIVTDYHLIVGKEKISVTFSDGSVFQATKNDGPPLPCGPVDLIIKNVPREKLRPVVMGSSKNLSMGEPIAAVRSAPTSSESIIGGKIIDHGKIIPPQVTNYRFPIADIININVPIDHSYYGGPLINMKGEVIGMNLAVSTWTGIHTNIGIVVPSNTINKVISSQIATGFFEHPWIGISGNNTSKGVIITEIIPNGPADKVKILKGDIISKIDNIPISTVDDILNHIQREKRVGDTLNLSIIRGGQIQEITLTLVARPEVEYLF
jgi:S1-C subfamily serine protease